MLQELHIENIAVIEKADVSLGSGLNILTGETGAGKSMIVDSLQAILGGRVSRELVRTGADKAVVCATFDPEPARAWCEEHEIDVEDELILRRQISAEGKTIIFTTHYMEEAVKLCNRIAIFREGSLVVSETKEKLQELYLSIEGELEDDEDE